MAGLIEGLDAGRVRVNLERVREVAGPDVEILAATKYVALEEMGVLAEAGVELVGENRLQDLEAKRQRWGDAFAWDFIARGPVRVAGLMTMPPESSDPEASRRHFARLAELAAEHGLERLSMGTSQDWEVAVEEGATIVRLGTILYI